LDIKLNTIKYTYTTTTIQSRRVKQLKVIPENSLLLQEDKEVIDCPRCGFEMKHMQACHMICPNCGAHMDCSEKGLTW